MPELPSRRRCIDVRCDGVMVAVFSQVQEVAESRKRMRVVRYHCLRCGLVAIYAQPEQE